MNPAKAVWLLAVLALLAACARPAAPLPEAPLPSATPAPAITFPRDAAPHDALTEWWYVTGHLASADGHRYGFEFVIFQGTRQNQPTGYLSHFAISDIDSGTFSHQARYAQVAQPYTAFPLNVDGWTLDHSDNADVIQAAMLPGVGAAPPFELHLTLRDQGKPPALHHGGYITYVPAGGSYYYSRTRLLAGGSLTLADGTRVDVTGQAWMDHQWGNFVTFARGGWDWYSLQLDDDTELMLYVIRSETGETTAVYGSHVLADGRVVDLDAGAVSSVVTGSWVSPHTGATYPSGWQLTLEDGSRLSVEPQLQDQELYFPQLPGSLVYWEGAVSVTGDRRGEGYVELTGYAP